MLDKPIPSQASTDKPVDPENYQTVGSNSQPDSSMMDTTVDSFNLQVLDVTDIHVDKKNALSRLVNSAKMKRFIAVRYSEPLTRYGIELRNPSMTISEVDQRMRRVNCAMRIINLV